MQKGQLGEGREIILNPGDQIPEGPMGTSELQAALKAGPSVPMSEVRGDIPPMPDPIFDKVPIVGQKDTAREEQVLQNAVEQKKAQMQPPSVSDLTARATGIAPVSPHAPEQAPQQPASQAEVAAPGTGEGPDDNMRKDMILPTDAEKAILKQQYPGPLRVVPIPYSREDGKIVCYILRQLTRAQWRAMEDAARMIAESKPDVSANEIFMEKIVCLASVWPDLQEHQIRVAPAGLVPTLFGIVQQMGLFFDPEVIMQVTFAL